MNPPGAAGRVRSRDSDGRDVGHPANRLDAALKQLRIAAEAVDGDAEVEARIEAALREAEGAAERLDSTDE